MQDAVVAVSTLDGTRKETVQQVDVAVVGAGFAGLYLLYRLHKAGFTTVTLEAQEFSIPSRAATPPKLAP